MINHRVLAFPWDFNDSGGGYRMTFSDYLILVKYVRKASDLVGAVTGATVGPR